MNHPSVPGSPAERSFVFGVAGMDCASCAATITTAIGKMPGVSEINISVAREMMTLRLDETRTPARSWKRRSARWVSA